MSKVVFVIFSILVAIGISALIGIFSPGAVMGEAMSGTMGGILLGLIVLLGLIAVFVIFN